MVGVAKTLQEFELRISKTIRFLKGFRTERTPSSLKHKLRACWLCVHALNRWQKSTRARLTQEELRLLERIYHNQIGLNSFLKIRETLQACGQNLTDTELSELLERVAYKEGFILGIGKFKQIMELLKRRHRVQLRQETDTTDAFAALGGNRNRTGEISATQLRQVVRYFDLTIDIDKLIEMADTDGSGLIEYDEFQCMFEKQLESEEYATMTSVFFDLRHHVLHKPDESDVLVGGWWRLGYRVKEAANFSFKQSSPMNNHFISEFDKNEGLPSFAPSRSFKVSRQPSSNHNIMHPRRTSALGAVNNDTFLDTKIARNIDFENDKAYVAMLSTIRSSSKQKKKPRSYRFDNNYSFDTDPFVSTKLRSVSTRKK